MPELLSTSCVQVILAARSAPLLSAPHRQAAGCGEAAPYNGTATRSALGTSVIVSYAQKPFFFKKLAGLVGCISLRNRL